MKVKSGALKRRLSSAQDLLAYGLIDEIAVQGIEKTKENFAIGVSDHLAALMAAKPNNSALTKQYIPDIAELNFTDSESNDPIGDDVHSPVKGIVHRYPDRVLFKIANACAVYCRYCFRREMIGPGSDFLSARDTEEALEYIRSHPKIWEVILTGGDPLILSAKQLNKALQDLIAIDHVRLVRIHSRVPVADPERINNNVLEALKSCRKPLYLVLHINHKDEITQQVKDLMKQMSDAGCNLLSQSVLLRGVNDNVSTLEDLFRELIAHNVKPYYLHHPDKAKGTSHFRLPLYEGMSIYQKLLGRLSGICQPSYMLDIPGGHGKIPINHSYIEEKGKGHYTVRDYSGNAHEYYDD